MSLYDEISITTEVLVNNKILPKKQMHSEIIHSNLKHIDKIIA